jgi:hypothetical protein
MLARLGDAADLECNVMMDECEFCSREASAQCSRCYRRMCSGCATTTIEGTMLVCSPCRIMLEVAGEDDDNDRGGDSSEAQRPAGWLILFVLVTAVATVCLSAPRF